jgi:FtsZ-binding cell division protein ZapB
MKTVKLVKLEYEEVPLLNRKDIEYFDYQYPAVIEFNSNFTDETLRKRLAPIIQICHQGREDVFVAYTKETEELLGVPVKLLKEEKDRLDQSNTYLRTEVSKLKDRNYWLHEESAGLKSRLHYYQTMSFWKRFKFLFKGSV